MSPLMREIESPVPPATGWLAKIVVWALHMEITTLAAEMIIPGEGSVRFDVNDEFLG
jgi:hypothetical protein